MKDDSIKKLFFNQIEHFVKDLENDVKTFFLNKELVYYSEGKLNGCITAYFKLFPSEFIPEPLWKQVIEVWDSITKMEEKDNK